MMSKEKKGIRAIFKGDTTTLQLLLLLIGVFIVMMLFNPRTAAKPAFIINMFYLFPEYGILALAMMMPIIAGGIDLSNIATANLAGIVACMFLRTALAGTDGTGPTAWIMLLLAFIIAMVVGLVCGMLPGFLIGNLGIPPMLATLGAADLIMGLALGFTKGTAVTGIPPVLNTFCNTFIFGIVPVMFIVFALVAAAASWLLTKSTFGYKLYMVGSNPTATRYSGINNRLIIYRTHMTSGLFAAISGMLMCGHFNTAKANLGTSYQTPSILICLLGAVSPLGGFGNVRNVVLAIGILQVLSSIINMIPDISTFYRDLVWGAVLILVLSIKHLARKK